jgi:cysteine protease ATG4
MANVKRLVQYFWDPPPTNNESSKSPIWCLGQEYRPSDPSSAPNPASLSPPGGDPIEAVQEAKPATPPDSTASSFDSGLAYEEARNAEEDGGWPPSFLDDFEARIWMTYRSGFPAIPKSQDPSAYSAMSFSVRIKSQLVDQGGFTSDTGWGCMIRSGQSLLANALVMLRMGRGQPAKHS